VRAERFLPDPEATRAAGIALGRAAEAGDVAAAVGTLGAGKTCLAQGLAEGLDVPPTHYVNSPTFAILQIHPGRMPFNHADLYRLGDPDEALGLGLEERIGVEGVSFVEWPNRVPELIPADALWVRLSPQGTGRLLECLARGPRSERWLQAAFPADA
jgi:tRNA threonylcarbamoyladenosine biosynthesis protein TsaE